MRIRTRRRRNENSFASFLCLLLCLVMIVGVTYAIFTSESNNNIVAGSGKVEVDAWIAEIATSSFGVPQAEGVFELGGTAKYDEDANKFTLDRMASGDAVSFNIHIKNNSNIAVSYRIKVAFSGELRDALVATIKLPGDETATTLTSADIATAWSNFEGLDTEITVPATIELPYDIGDNYQNMSASIVVTVEAVQANATNLVMIGNTRYDTIEEAVAAAQDGNTISLAGDFVMPNVSNKKLTFAAIKDSFTTLDMSAGNNSFGSTLAFEDLTVNFDDTEHYKGLTNATEVSYTNCVINGQQTMYAPKVSFTGCEFVNYSGYNVWTYGASNVSFTDCTFTTGGRAVLIYNEEVSSSFVTNVKLTKCEFISNGAYFAANPEKPKAAVETGSNGGNTETSNKYNITFEACTVDDNFQANNSNSALWGNKNGMDDEHLLVLVDGVAQTNVDKYVAINNLQELKAFRDNVNAGNNYAGKIVVLTNDIDLGNEEWTSIGLTKATAFAGAFDGNGHTISNLYMSKSSRDDGYYAGLFAHSNMTEMKNLTIHNANVSGGNISAVLIARQHAAIDISNLDITGDVYLTITNSEGGLVVANGAVDSISDVSVDVSESSYVKCLTTSTETWEYLGGVWGHVWPTEASNIYSNIDVYGYASSVGGIGGGCAISSDNVVCDGDVIITIDDTENYRGYDCSMRNGLIYGFGVGSSNTATHKNCVATGTLTINGNVITSLETTDDHNTASTLWTNGYSSNDVRFGAPYYAAGVITIQD